MQSMRRVFLPLGLLGLAAVVVVVGCQSVATTSAKLRNQEGNYELAIDLAKQALAQNPNDAEAYFQLGVSYSNLDSVSLAYQNFSKAAEMDPKKKSDADNNIKHNFAKHYKLGQSAYKRQDYQAAAQEFDLATKADPTQAVGFYNLGVAYAQLATENASYHEKAIAAMDKVLDLSSPSDANYVKALQVAGKELAESGHPEEAQERFKRLIEEDPSNYSVIEEIGNELLHKNPPDYKGAVVFLKMAAEAREKVDSPDFTVDYNIGAALYNMRDQDSTALDEAITYYKKALDIRENEPQTLFNVVVAYVAKEDWANARDWGEKYVNVVPSDAKGWQLLARIYSELGEKDKAREALARFSQLRGAGGN